MPRENVYICDQCGASYKSANGLLRIQAETESENESVPLIKWEEIFCDIDCLTARLRSVITAKVVGGVRVLREPFLLEKAGCDCDRHCVERGREVQEHDTETEPGSPLEKGCIVCEYFASIKIDASEGKCVYWIDGKPAEKVIQDSSKIHEYCPLYGKGAIKENAN